MHPPFAIMHPIHTLTDTCILAYANHPHVFSTLGQGLDPAGLNLLIQSGAPVNYQDMWKRTPLHYAVRAGQIEACQRLIELGADVR